MTNSYKYLIGVDGGGSGTRVIIADHSFKVLATAEGAPSALGQGIEKAWKAIMDTIARAFYNGNLSAPMLSECSIGIGISGANNLIWKNEFYLRNPGFNSIFVDTDGFTTLMGAHQGSPGVIVAVGTGSVGMVLNSNGKRSAVSGWGFPAGDESSGAWLGLRAAAYTQKALDGRAPASSLSKSVLEYCGKDCDQFLKWLGNANQNSFAQLAPLVFQSAHSDPFSKKLLSKAGEEIKAMVIALNPELNLPLSICGRLGMALVDHLPIEIKSLHRPAIGDSTVGALYLTKKGFSP